MMKKLILGLILAAALLSPKAASATILTFDLTPQSIAGFWNVFIDPSGDLYGTAEFEPSNATFAFDTSNGVGTLTANMELSFVDPASGGTIGSIWQMTGIFSNTSYINPANGFDPGNNYDLYFDYLVNHSDNPPTTNPFADWTAIAFDSVNIDLTGSGGYNGLTHFAGGAMDGHMAYIHYMGPGSNGTSNFNLAYWCYTDWDNDSKGQGDTFTFPFVPGAGGNQTISGTDVANTKLNADSSVSSSESSFTKEIKEELACDHFWNMNGTIPGDPTDPNVPEPATMALLSLGLIGLKLRKNKRSIA